MPASIQPGETGNHGKHQLPSLVITPQLEEALGLLYRGQTNVAKKAKELDIPLALLKTFLNKHITQIPTCDDAWNADIELGWPYIT